MNELSEIFSGLTTMSRVKKNGNNIHTFIMFKYSTIYDDMFKRKFTDMVY